MNNSATLSESTLDSTETKTKPISLAKTKPEKIRVELNIEKWPGIWQPAKGHTRLALRTLERRVELKDGSRAVSKLLIGFTELGTLSTEDQRMFYALIRQWEEAGKPFGKPIYFSDRLLSRLLRKKGWGTNVIDAMTGSLRRLRTIPLRWIKSFHKNDPASSEYEEEIPFQFLGDLKIITRKAHGHVTNQQGYFQFDRNIEANLHANYTKPLLDEVFFKLESEIAQLLYTHIDLIMFGKTRYERCTKDLFTDLGLSGASYRFRSNRKQKLERALVELRGIRLNHGVLKSASIQETRDGKDYKVIFIKGSHTEPDALNTQVPEAETDVVVNHYARIQDPLHLQADELVRYFHEVFHNVRAHDPQLKETSQALALVAQHGLNDCRRIVDFARNEAAKTNYGIQHFGGVLSYTSRALAARAGERSVKPTSETSDLRYRPVVPKGETWARGERRFQCLTPSQRESRLEKTKASLFLEKPLLARILNSSSKVHEQMIRARVIRELENEPMDLVPLNYLPDWARGLSQNLPL